MRLRSLNEALAREGLALPNLGDVDVQSVAGALSTGTHGTGAGFKNLSAQVESLELVSADGTLCRVSASDEDTTAFRAARVGVGALGVMTSVTLRCVPAFNLYAQEIPTPLPEVLARLDDEVERNEHYEFFAFPHAPVALVRVNNRTDAPKTAGSRGAVWLREKFLENHLLGLACRVGRAAPSAIPRLNRLVMRLASRSEWVDRSDRVFTSPRLIRFNEMEYALPRACAQDAIREVLTISERHAVNFPLEVRFVAGDDALLSPTFERDSCYIAVHAFRGMAYEPFFREVESAVDRWAGRPHWGKHHFQSEETLRSRYPGWADFQRVRGELDPRGIFTTPALERVLGPVQARASAVQPGSPRAPLRSR
jgi:L-gulonolactone oxidase